jgi:hypothetical protein
MARTRPTTDQLRFNSSANGESILDDYMEACEKGGRSLPDLLDELFDNVDGNLKNFIQLREDPLNQGTFQIRLGTYVDPNAGWETFTYTDLNQLLIDAQAARDAALAAQTAAELAETNAAASQSAASLSESNASTSETNASNSAAAALASQNAAALSETNAAASETAAGLSETAAAASESAAALSESNAATSASNASTSESNAALSETNASGSAAAALASQNAAALSESNAATSETNAATSASNALTSEGNAATSESNAATSASNASTSETNAAASEAKAELWANEAEDVEVEPGLFSAYHYSRKADGFLQAAITSTPADGVINQAMSADWAHDLISGNHEVSALDVNGNHFTRPSPAVLPSASRVVRLRLDTAGSTSPADPIGPTNSYDGDAFSTLTSLVEWANRNVDEGTTALFIRISAGTYNEPPPTSANAIEGISISPRFQNINTRVVEGGTATINVPGPIWMTGAFWGHLGDSTYGCGNLIINNTTDGAAREQSGGVFCEGFYCESINDPTQGVTINAAVNSTTWRTRAIVCRTELGLYLCVCEFNGGASGRAVLVGGGKHKGGDGWSWQASATMRMIAGSTTAAELGGVIDCGGATWDTSGTGKTVSLNHAVTRLVAVPSSGNLLNGCTVSYSSVAGGVIYGSNSNGHYLKFTNGTLIVWKDGTVSNISVAAGDIHPLVDLAPMPISFNTGTIQGWSVVVRGNSGTNMNATSLCVQPITTDALSNSLRVKNLGGHLYGTGNESTTMQSFRWRLLAVGRWTA